ncbi:hypothetical protein [Herbaspirillum sp. VT-16-41]|uniref:hypothetical protein n=1 Tax=Herbaspirillum sp. VT-16-41 TaxID=1953765 RepID=UPI0011158A18|nr:hypothetical protein [Herbaspirillum sp. VT-16-41]
MGEKAGGGISCQKENRWRWETCFSSNFCEKLHKFFGKLPKIQLIWHSTEEKVSFGHARRRVEEDNIAFIPPFLIRATLVASATSMPDTRHRPEAAPASLEELF